MHFSGGCRSSKVLTTEEAFEVNLAVSIVPWDLQDPSIGVGEPELELGRVRTLITRCPIETLNSASTSLSSISMELVNLRGGQIPGTNQTSTFHIRSLKANSTANVIKLILRIKDLGQHHHPHYCCQYTCSTKLVRKEALKLKKKKKTSDSSTLCCFLRVVVEELQDEQLFVVSFFATSSSLETWLIDSGCTNHMTYDQGLFKELDKTITSKVRIGNGAYLAVKSKGTGAIKGHTGLKLISNVLYVPEINQNLLSVGQLLEKGYKVLFEDNHCMIADAQGREVFIVQMKGKSFALDVVIVTNEGQPVLDNISNDKNKYLEIGIPNKKELQTTTNCALNESVEHMPNKVICLSHVSSDETEDNTGDEVDAVKETPGLKQSSKSSGVEGILKLYLKGIEIYGRNSCLIARNLLSGLKTCIEVSSYMYDDGSAMLHRSAIVSSSFLEDNGRGDADYTEQEMPTRSQLFRRRGRTWKPKYSWKSYTPCGCLSICGKECPYQSNGTCCEKYCGCSKSCKNRFRGCHCANSQCRSRQCPCFAAGRECDLDVCRNCWVSCGDGSLGEPSKRGDGQCGNMRLLLRKQQRILLAKSDVVGWGALLKNSINKNDYLGEYTGELISHREADKRGKIYDRANSSFLFYLNDQYVLDASHKGEI
ncbi:hypothetical protein PVL29_020743 [Vitis rotundifolia]|uniref:CXC domain-containing protein n=1 Tax=Vitis rotundifolia TaxID=103349 RepID=A0AA39DCK8_VITRO|nr:hypothetical protein PVL29_020743 [Vitis rotundifolia]